MAFKSYINAGRTETHFRENGQIITAADKRVYGGSTPEFDLGIGTSTIQSTCITAQAPSGNVGIGVSGIAIGHSRIFVGNTIEANTPAGKGCVHMFDFDGNYMGRIDHPETGTDTSTGFGWNPVCADGLLIISSNDFAGDPNIESGWTGIGDTGRTYIYDQLGNLLHTLPLPSNLYGSSDGFGMGVHAGEGRIVVGRQRADTNNGTTYNDFTGNATIYDYNGNIVLNNVMLHNGWRYYDGSGNAVDRSTGLDLDAPSYSDSFGGRTYGGHGQQAIGYGKIVIGAVDQNIWHHPDKTADRVSINGHAYIFDLNGNFVKGLYMPLGWEDSIPNSNFGHDISIGSDRILVMGNTADNDSGVQIGRAFVYDGEGNYLFQLTGQYAPITGSNNPSVYLKSCGIYGGIIGLQVNDDAHPDNPTANGVRAVELYDINGNYIARVLPEDMSGNIVDDTVGQYVGIERFALGYGLLVTATYDTSNTANNWINIYKLPTTYDGLIEKASGRTQN
jgi:hypothetical protein